MNTATAEKQNKIMYISQAENFSKIPGSPIAYWVVPSVVNCFETNNLLNEIVEVRNGLKTGNNEIFVRLWHEVLANRLCLYAKNADEASLSQKKWFPYNKGGEYRKWYGNDYYILNWENTGFRVIDCAKNEKRNVQDYPNEYKFIPIVTWSLITSSDPSFRYKAHCISDICGMSMYTTNKHILDYILGFVNGPIALYILNALNPTLNYQAGDIARLPIIVDDNKKSNVNQLVHRNIELSKTDWDSFETSWDFKKHPLI